MILTNDTAPVAVAGATTSKAIFIDTVLVGVSNGVMERRLGMVFCFWRGLGFFDWSLAIREQIKLLNVSLLFAYGVRSPNEQHI